VRTVFAVKEKIFLVATKARINSNVFINLGKELPLIQTTIDEILGMVQNWSVSLV